MTDVMAKLVDLRGVAKPPMFTGRVEDWSDFRFKMENITALLSLDDLLQREASGSACLEPGDEPKGKFLYNLLVQVCHGKALALVRLVPRADGASAWRSLVQEDEPDEASRHCALLVGLMSPDWKEGVPFVDQLLAWEKRLTEYEVAAVATAPDTFKCAIVMKYAPKSVKEFLRITPEDLTRDYGRLRHALQTYQTRGRAYDGTGCLVGPEGALPMEVGTLETTGEEVDAINVKGKAKGKGKVGPCFKCNQMGHLKANCRVTTQLRCEKCGKVGHKGADCRGGGKGIRTAGGRQQQQPSKGRWQRRRSRCAEGQVPGFALEVRNSRHSGHGLPQSSGHRR